MIRHIHHLSRPSNEQLVQSKTGVKGWPSIYKAETSVVTFPSQESDLRRSSLIATLPERCYMPDDALRMTATETISLSYWWYQLSETSVHLSNEHLMFTWTSPTNSNIYFPLIVTPTFSLERSRDLEDGRSLCIAQRHVTTSLEGLERIAQKACDHQSKELYKDLIRRDPENHERISWVAEAIGYAAKSLQSSHQHAAKHAECSEDISLLTAWRSLYQTFEDFSANLCTRILSEEHKYLMRRDGKIRQLAARSGTSLPARLSAELLIHGSTVHLGTLYQAINSAGIAIEGLHKLDEQAPGFKSNRLTDPVFLLAAYNAGRIDRTNGTLTGGIRSAIHHFHNKHSDFLTSSGFDDPESLFTHVLSNQRAVSDLGEEFAAGFLSEEAYLKRLTALGGSRADHPTISDAPNSVCTHKTLKKVTLDEGSVGTDTKANHIEVSDSIDPHDQPEHSLAVDGAWENMRR